jgi:hypothetical protein
LAVFFGLLRTQLNTAINPKRESIARSIQPTRPNDEITPVKQIKFNPRERFFPSCGKGRFFIKNSRHGSGMSVFSQQLENPGLI